MNESMISFYFILFFLTIITTYTIKTLYIPIVHNAVHCVFNSYYLNEFQLLTKT